MILISSMFIICSVCFCFFLVSHGRAGMAGMVRVAREQYALRAVIPQTQVGVASAPARKSVAPEQRDEQQKLERATPLS
jgi:hypothetical protein